MILAQKKHLARASENAGSYLLCKTLRTASLLPNYFSGKRVFVLNYKEKKRAFQYLPFIAQQKALDKFLTLLKKQ